MRRRIVPELLDTSMAIEGGLHDTALHTNPPPVNNANVAEAGVGGRINVSVDDRGNVAWGEGVKIEVIFNRDVVCIAHCGSGAARYV